VEPALTGSLPDKPADKAKPPAIEGWVLRDVYDLGHRSRNRGDRNRSLVRLLQPVHHRREAGGLLAVGVLLTLGRRPTRRPTRAAPRPGPASGRFPSASSGCSARRVDALGNLPEAGPGLGAALVGRLVGLRRAVAQERQVGGRAAPPWR
jgi:hypothetical protein